MLEISTSSESQLFQVAIYTPTINFPILSGQFSAVVSGYDIWFRLLREQCFYTKLPGFWTASQIIGFKNQDSASTLLVRHKPDSYEYDASIDQKNYGTFVRNFQLFDTALTGRNYYVPHPRTEHVSSHWTYSGILTPEQLPLTEYSSSFVSASILFTGVKNLGTTYYARAHVNSVSPLSCSVIGLSNGFRWVDLASIVSFLKGGVTVIYNGGAVTSTISAMRLDIDSDSITVSHHSVVHERDNNVDYKYDCTTRIPIAGSTPTKTPVLGNDFDATQTLQTLVSFSNGVVVNPYLSPGPLSGVYTVPANSRAFCGFASGGPALPIELQGSSSLSAFEQLTYDRRFLTPFRQEVERRFRDIAASCLFSSVDAFLAAEDGVNNNVIQSLAKLPEIVEFLPKIGEAVDLLEDVAKRRLSLSSIKTILDVASSATLMASFQIRPAIDLLLKYLPEMLKIVKLMGTSSPNLIARGSYTKLLKNKLGRKEVTLVTRTKIVMSSGPQDLLAAILGLDSIGLAPKVSNAWDLIPFSFVANWFFGIGANIRRAEYLAVMATIPAYYVHSFTLTSQLTADELALLKSTSAEQDPASLRVYIRDVSHYTPPFRDTDFDFGIPTQLPPLGLLGSLLYQLVLG